MAWVLDMAVAVGECTLPILALLTRHLELMETVLLVPVVEWLLLVEPVGADLEVVEVEEAVVEAAAVVVEEDAVGEVDAEVEVLRAVPT